MTGPEMHSWHSTVQVATILLNFAFLAPKIEFQFFLAGKLIKKRTTDFLSSEFDTLELFWRQNKPFGFKIFFGGKIELKVERKTFYKEFDTFELFFWRQNKFRFRKLHLSRASCKCTHCSKCKWTFKNKRKVKSKNVVERTKVLKNKSIKEYLVSPIFQG